MRKHQAPIGWTDRDPRRYRFPIPNSVWEHQIKPAEVVILSYLCYCHTHGSKHKPISAEAISQAVHMTTRTVKKYLSLLMHKGTISERYSLTSEFQCEHSKNFFTLPNEIFLLNLPPSAFMVYAYLLLVEDRKTHTCHPSYNTITAETGMSKNTVIKSVGTLLDKGLITMEYSRYIDQHGMKWNGNNLYTILPIRQAVDSFYQQQLYQMESNVKRRRFHKRQSILCTRPDVESGISPSVQ